MVVVFLVGFFFFQNSMHILSARFHLPFVVRDKSLNFPLFQQTICKMGKMFVFILPR